MAAGPDAPAVLEAIPAGVLLVDADGIVQWANGTASRPVPTPSSSTVPVGDASAARNATVAGTSLMSRYQSSYTSANASP